MKFSVVVPLACTLSSVVFGGVLQKRASNSWAGGNLYFLHGLSGSDQDYYIDTMAANGAKIVRLWGKFSRQILSIANDQAMELWRQRVEHETRPLTVLCRAVTGTSGCQKGSSIPTPINELEPTTIGTFDDGVLNALDGVLAKLVAKGMKAIISPHDGNAFGVNSCDVYGQATGTDNKCPTTDPNHSAADKFYLDLDLQTKYDTLPLQPSTPLNLNPDTTRE